MEKIIYIANIRMPTERAHGIQVMKMCEALAKHDVVELIVPGRFTHIKENPFKYYDVEENFKVTKLPCLDLIPLARFLGNFAFWVESFSFLVSAKIYLIRQKYDTLYTREIFAGFFFKDFILEIHSLPEKIKNFHKNIWQKAKAYVVLTSYIKKKLTEAGVEEDKILIAPDAVDFEKFDIKISKEEVRKKLNLPTDKKIVMYVGSFGKWKGADVLLEASKQFSEDVLFVFVGDAKNKRDYKDTKFVGYKTYEEIPYWLKSADVLVLPNSGKEKISKFYTSPMKLFEYMASEAPMVVSDLPSIREILGQANAILVEPDNPEKLAEGIKTILQNKELSDKISKQAYQDVQNYTWKKRAQKILNFIT